MPCARAWPNPQPTARYPGPGLQARSLLKQRRYAAAMAELLSDRGADAATARLAAETALACYYAGRAAAGEDPADLPAAVDAAFARLV